MRVGYRSTAFALLSGLCMLAVASPASATDPREAQIAQALFDEARLLMEKKQFADACPKFAESQRLDPGAGTFLNLAVCHEAEGKLATALGEFHEGHAAAVRDGRRDRQDVAQKHISSIERIVPRVTVVVPGAAAAELEDVEVKLDGFVLRRAAWGVPMPVDAGQHVVTSSAPRHMPWNTTFTIRIDERKTVEVPALAPAPPTTLTSATVPVATHANVASVPSTVDSGAFDPAPVERHPNPAFYGALVVSAVAITTSMVTGSLAFTNYVEGQSRTCYSASCDNHEQVDAQNRANTYLWLSVGSLVVASIGGIVMAVAPRSVSSRPASPVDVSVGPNGGQVGWHTTF